jgi:hypothetical protein
MSISLIVKGRNYSQETLSAWQEVWGIICKMAYENATGYNSIITTPSFMMVERTANDTLNEKEHSNYYNKKIPDNDYDITLDHTWKKYSRMYPTSELSVNLQFEKLHVPRALFESLGIYRWFQYSFPNCKITFWEE